MRFLLLLLSAATLLTSGCGTVARGKDGKDGLTNTTKVSRVVKGMEANAFEAKFMEGSARINLESDKLNIGGTATIRLERDKAIWVSVKKFGLEGARALIRPDSFFVYNRLSGDYTAEPLSYIKEKYQVPAEFDLLQKIVLGNAIFLPAISNSTKLERPTNYTEKTAATPPTTSWMAAALNCKRWTSAKSVPTGKYKFSMTTSARWKAPKKTSPTGAPSGSIPRSRGRRWLKCRFGR